MGIAVSVSESQANTDLFNHLKNKEKVVCSAVWGSFPPRWLRNEYSSLRKATLSAVPASCVTGDEEKVTSETEL